jgi:tetratricopeptide (TPR) repeat protein
MNNAKCFIVLMLICISNLLLAQESAIYKNSQDAYNRGMHFYNQKLYSQALAEFDNVASESNQFQDTDVPMYMLEAELHAGLSALYTDRPDSEKRLLDFIEKKSPSPVATHAKLAIGNYYYNQRDYAQTIKYLIQVSNLDLNNEEIIGKKFKLGYCYFVKKKFSKAQSYFKQIKEAKTQYYYPSNYYYGITVFFDKKYDEALESFTRVQKSKRYSKIVPSYICQIYFAKKQYKELIKYGRPLLEDNSIREREQVSQLMGQAYFELGEYKKALPLLDAYVNRTKKVTKEALYQLGYTQYKVGKYKEAIKNFEQLNALNDKLGQNALYNMADCLLKTGNKSAARQAFQKASQKKFDLALQEDALINYAKLSYELGFDNDAISALQSINTGSDYYNEAQNLMSKVFLNTRDYDKALEILRKMPSKTAKIKEVHQKVAYFRGLQLFNDRKYDKAIVLFDESLKLGINTETKALSYFWKAESQYKKKAYDLSIREYTNFVTTAEGLTLLPDNSSEGVANYGLGYSYIKKGDYGNASRYFNKSVAIIKPNLSRYNDKYVTNFVYPDALLRAGDCLLFLRNYSQAKNYYKTVVNKKYANNDYAMFQLSLIHNLQNQPTDQIVLLDRIINNYPKSLYADDALYAKGNAYFNMDKKDLAISAYETLLNTYPSSENVNKAMLKLGLIAYSFDRNEEALNFYKGVFRANTESEEAKDALIAIKEIYIQSGNPDGYFNFVNTVQGYEVGEYERDSLLFVSAQMKFDNADWEGAVTSYTSYLERFPTGMHSMQVHYNRGEALFDLKRYDEAISDYAYISDNGNPTYAEIANHRAANIAYYSTQNFPDALKYYGRLEKVATTEEKLFEAQQFGMRSAFYAADFQLLPGIAERFMKNSRATPSDHAEANYFIGKAYLSQKNYDTAFLAFNKNIELSGDDARSAESHYWRAYITYEKRDLDKAMDLCFENNKKIPGHPYWLVKSFILLADVYAEKDNLFQAKATLQSIVDNYEGDQELLNEANRKLVLVIEAEKSNSKIKRESPDGEMEMIEEN